MLGKLKIVLKFLNSVERDDVGEAWVDGPTLKEKTGLEIIDINDIVEIAVNRMLVKWQRYIGTAPYIFGHVTITAEGRFWLETN